MHRSRISTLLIDVPLAEVPAAVRFWAGATGVVAAPVPGEEQYISLPEAMPGWVVAIQQVDDTHRYHLDFETDDVAAEADRLIALGAEEVGRWDLCRTLRAPGGHFVCVIPLHSDEGEFSSRARTWP